MSSPIQYLNEDGIKQIGKAIPKIWTGTKKEWEDYDKTLLINGAIVNIIDDCIETDAFTQTESMPDNAPENTIVQYVGETTSDFTNGYFYKNITDETGILSWKNIPVMNSAEINDETIATNTTWSSEKINDMISTKLQAIAGNAATLDNHSASDFVLKSEYDALAARVAALEGNT